MGFYTDLFRKGWAAFRRDWKLVLCAALFAWLPAFAYYTLVWTGVVSREGYYVWISFLPAFIRALFAPGNTIIWLKLLREEKAELRDLLTGLHFAGKYLLAALLLILMMTGVFLAVIILLLINGHRSNNAVFFMIVSAVLFLVYLACLYGLASQTAVDIDTKGPVAVLRSSRKLLRGHRWRFMGLMLILLVPTILSTLLDRIHHPAAYGVCMILGFAVVILDLMGVNSFYEMIKPVERKDRGLRNRLRKERRRKARAGA